MSTNSKPKMTDIEIYGVESIPAADRTSTPSDLFKIAFGGANSFATVLLGAFPIFFGLSLMQGLLATLLGVVVGSAILEHTLASLAVYSALIFRSSPLSPFIPSRCGLQEMPSSAAQFNSLVGTIQRYSADSLTASWRF